jgi:hypothetical protein
MKSQKWSHSKKLKAELTNPLFLGDNCSKCKLIIEFTGVNMKINETAIEKVFSARGPMQQFRLKELNSFHCFRCGRSKTSKLVSIYKENWSMRLCNGCYGFLLSIYNIKSGIENDTDKSNLLSEILLTLITSDQIKESEKLIKLSENRYDYLSPKALRFVATSEYVSKALENVSELDWSTAIIGLCKAFEVEITNRILDPLSKLVVSEDLTEDSKDKDIGRVAKYYLEASSKPPELGTFAHFLITIINSQKRRDTSTLMKAFIRLISTWPKSSWLTDSSGCWQSLGKLAKEFRNRAAHTDELTKNDYEECRDFVVGQKDILWQLVTATQSLRL